MGWDPRALQNSACVAGLGSSIFFILESQHDYTSIQLLQVQVLIEESLVQAVVMTCIRVHVEVLFTYFT